MGDGEGRHGEGLGVAARIALEPDDVVLLGRVIGGENLQHARHGLREVGEVVAQVLALGVFLWVVGRFAFWCARNEGLNAQEFVGKRAQVALGSFIQVGPTAGLLDFHQVIKFLGQVREATGIAQRLRAVGGHLDGAGSNLRGGYRGDAAVELMSLIDNGDVVLRQDICLRNRVDGEHGVVGDHDVDVGSRPASLFRKAIRPVRAARRAQALVGGDRYRPPYQVRYARL